VTPDKVLHVGFKTSVSGKPQTDTVIWLHLPFSKQYEEGFPFVIDA